MAFDGPLTHKRRNNPQETSGHQALPEAVTIIAACPQHWRLGTVKYGVPPPVRMKPTGSPRLLHRLENGSLRRRVIDQERSHEPAFRPVAEMWPLTLVLSIMRCQTSVRPTSASVCRSASQTRYSTQCRKRA